MNATACNLCDATARPWTCECEDARCEDGCPIPAAGKLRTIYGRFALCRACLEEGHMGATPGAFEPDPGAFDAEVTP